MRRLPGLLPFTRDIPGPLAGLLPGQAAGVGMDDFALYTALRTARGAGGTYLVSWPWNIATQDGLGGGGALNMVAGRLCLIPQLVPPGIPVDGVEVVQTVNGNYTASNTNGVAAYTFDGANWTRIAQGVGAATWQSGTGANPIPFSAQLAAASTWRLLWAAILYNNSAQVTAPQLAGMQVSNSQQKQLGLGFYGFQEDLNASNNFPATIATGSVSTTQTNRYWAGFYHVF